MSCSSVGVGKVAWNVPDRGTEWHCVSEVVVISFDDEMACVQTDKGKIAFAHRNRLFQSKEKAIGYCNELNCKLGHVLMT